MRINEDNVDLPENLLKSLEEGNLVVFAGAGVSGRAFSGQKETTCYPLFAELVKGIAAELGIGVDAALRRRLTNGQADRILGEWEKSRPTVREVARDIVSRDPGKQRIDLHRAIVRLLTVAGSPRLVTTNFDRLFERALEEEKLSEDPRLQVYSAPALPPGGRWQGLCYLHGRVSSPEDMVLTDRDIGRAYMDEGWALRFAHGLFQKHDVLFLGYSLEDPPLRYLALALEATTRKRWVMQPVPLKDSARASAEEDWDRRGVRVTWYTAPRKDYRALERTLGDWCEDLSAGFSDRRNRLADVARSGPATLPPHQLGRALRWLRAPELLRDFAQESPNAAWLPPIAVHGLAPGVLAGSTEWTDGDREVASWIGRGLAGAPGEWGPIVAPYRNRIPGAVVSAFCKETKRRRQNRGGLPPTADETAELAKMGEFLEPAIRRRQDFSALHDMAPVLEDLLDGGELDTAIWLFALGGQVTTDFSARDFPDLVIGLDDEWAVGDTWSPRLEGKVELPHAHHNYSLSRTLHEVFLPRVGALGDKLLERPTCELWDLRLRLRRLGRDGYTYMRIPTIERRSGSHHREDPESFFVDAVRDTWEALLKVDAGTAARLSASWTGVNDIVFQRLALHAARRLVEAGHVG